MSTIRADLGVAGLLDVGYRFYDQTTASGPRVSAGILDEGDGWYSATGVLAGDHVRWDSTGTPLAKAREDLTMRLKVELLTTDVPLAATRLLTMLTLDGAVYQLTANALELAPASGGVGGGLTAGQAATLSNIEAHTNLITVGGFTVLSPVALNGGQITARAGDSWSILVAGLGSVAGDTKLWFTLKSKPTDADEAAQIFITRDLGLVTLAGAAAATPGQAALVVEDAALGNLRVTVEEAATLLIAKGGVWAIKRLSSTGQAVTLVSSKFNVLGATIRAIT